MYVSTNVSLPSILPRDEHPEVKLESVHQLFSDLKIHADKSPKTNILRVISLHLHSHYGVMVKKAQWMSHGILFNIRALSTMSLDTFTTHCQDKLFATNLTELSFLEDIASTLNISDTELTVQISPAELHVYKNAHLQAQGKIGIILSIIFIRFCLFSILIPLIAVVPVHSVVALRILLLSFWITGVVL